ncbi:uncharacterized protein LAJ45_09887 [Morchella importuna]|uniref:uncharacterized protein n=1 Tax=Morchella importuna TaxID=1174673 RepID=UPI001E8D57F9|nr:uncharacterized protein LAJ45_09887 [Morchella importuna]KAH8146189.1 hypothetical protein LAJ45_09887 [Morchella importuna]
MTLQDFNRPQISARHKLSKRRGCERSFRLRSACSRTDDLNTGITVNAKRFRYNRRASSHVMLCRADVAGVPAS